LALVLPRGSSANRGSFPSTHQGRLLGRLFFLLLLLVGRFRPVRFTKVLPNLRRHNVLVLMVLLLRGQVGRFGRCVGKDGTSSKLIHLCGLYVLRIPQDNGSVGRNNVVGRRRRRLVIDLQELFEREQSSSAGGTHPSRVLLEWPRDDKAADFILLDEVRQSLFRFGRDLFG